MNLSDITPTDCSCKGCVSMCHHSPCFGTPEDISKLIEAGYSDKLTCSVFLDSRNGDMYQLIAPKGIDNSDNILDGHTCVFLEGDKCSLHDLGLKPTEGRLAIHGTDPNHSFDLRAKVCDTWESPNGYKVWREFDELKRRSLIDSFKSLMDILNG